MIRRGRTARVALVAVVAAGGMAALSAAPAAAFNPIKPVCGVAGFVSGAAGKLCTVVQNGKRLGQAGKQLITGHLGGAVKTLSGSGTGAGAVASTVSTASTALGLAAIGAWVLGGAAAVLHETAAALSATTTPQLDSSWFSSTYWRMAAIAALITLPFLFAAAVQALVRSDLALLTKAAFGYLPLSMLLIAIATPLTMLLLAASDQLCTVISSAAADASAHFIERAGVVLAALSVLAHTPLLGFLVGLFMVGAAFALWVELLLREAAVYAVVLMLPLAFAAFVWPARRIWAIRAVEVLVALILSKFAIVAVLSLGGAAVSAGAFHGGVRAAMAGAVLIMLAAFAPWALLRLVPLAELATGAAGALRGELRGVGDATDKAAGRALRAHELVENAMSNMSQNAERGMADSTANGQATGQSLPAEDSRTPAPSANAASAQADGEAPDGQVPPSFADDWATQTELDLGGEKVGSTPVWPHPDAQ